jgi:hypothetical protein
VDGNVREKEVILPQGISAASGRIQSESKFRKAEVSAALQKGWVGNGPFPPNQSMMQSFFPARIARSPPWSLAWLGYGLPCRSYL